MGRRRGWGGWGVCMIGWLDVCTVVLLASPLTLAFCNKWFILRRPRTWIFLACCGLGRHIHFVAAARVRRERPDELLSGRAAQILIHAADEGVGIVRDFPRYVSALTCIYERQLRSPTAPLSSVLPARHLHRDLSLGTKHLL